MVAKLFTKPFGVAGDKTPIPDGTQVDGTVSYETGFGADYGRQLGVDPAAKNIGRQTFNELMFDVTTGLQETQAGFGTSVYSLALAQALPGGGYPKGALIPRLAGDGFWLCTTAANTSNPDTGGAGWVQVAMPQGSFYAIDTGVANAYSCVFSPALTTRSETQPLTVRIKFTNTGASTINDGLGTVPLVGLAQAPLQGGEVAANGVALLQWVAAISSYAVVYASGGRVQAANATRSLHAVNAGQIQGQSVTAFTTTGTATAQVLTPVPAISGYSASQRFNVTFNVASGLNPTINISGLGAKSLNKYDSAGAKVAADFFAGMISDIVYDGVDFVLLDPPSSAAVDAWAAKFVGEIVYIPTHMAGFVEPPTNLTYRYVKLTASDVYNSGVVTSEAVSGVAPLVSATGVISLAGSPFDGQTIRLLNSERRSIRPGSAGVIEQDAFQGYKLQLLGSSGDGFLHTPGATGPAGNGMRWATSTTVDPIVEAGAPVSDGTNGTPRAAIETRIKSLGLTAYMRIK